MESSNTSRFDLYFFAIVTSAGLMQPLDEGERDREKERSRKKEERRMQLEMLKRRMR